MSTAQSEFEARYAEPSDAQWIDALLDNDPFWPEDESISTYINDDTYDVGVVPEVGVAIETDAGDHARVLYSYSAERASHTAVTALLTEAREVENDLLFTIPRAHPDVEAYRDISERYFDAEYQGTVDTDEWGVQYQYEVPERVVNSLQYDPDVHGPVLKRQ